MTYLYQIKPGTLVYASKTHASNIPRGLVGKVKRADDSDFGKGIFIDWGAFGAAEGKDVSASPEPPVKKNGVQSDMLLLLLS